MKKADKFDPAKWLVENKITFQSRLNEIKNFDDNAKAYGILFVDNDDEDEIEETPYIWNEKAVEDLVMSMGYEDAEEIAGEFIGIFSPGIDEELDIFRTQENNPNLEAKDLTIGMYKKNIKKEFPNLNEIERMPNTDYEDAWEKGGGMDDEEFDFYSATIVDKPFPDAKGNDRMIPTLVVDETGDEYQEFYILNTPEDEENLKNDQEMGREIEGVFKVKMDNGEIKTAVVYPPTSSRSEFYGKFNENDLKKYKGVNAALALINENTNQSKLNEGKYSDWWTKANDELSLDFEDDIYSYSNADEDWQRTFAKEVINLETNNYEEFKNKVKELYDELNPF
jgi:hypothetical protein